MTEPLISSTQTLKVNTSGGASIAGSVNITGGDFVGRDKIVGLTAEQVVVLLNKIGKDFQPKPFTGQCPYLGLDEFGEQNAEQFFGRTLLIADLIGRVKSSRFVIIAGPSGSGKSSLIRAGLLHLLKQGGIPKSEQWLYVPLKPGRDPVEQLAWAISRVTKQPDDGDYIRVHGMLSRDALHRKMEALLTDQIDQRGLVIIDQFEEAFTQVISNEERNAFLNMLTYAATVENGRVIVLFILRSDFVSNFAEYPHLNTLLNQQFLQVGAMQPDELVQAIASPALQVGLRIDPDLIAQIVNDMENEPGALPLMQFALKDLFDAQHAKGDVSSLNLTDYIERGGLHKALQRHADNAFDRLSDAEKQIAREIFKRLTQPGQGTQDIRRIAFFKELIPANADDSEVSTVVQKLAAARLITTDEQGNQNTVTLSHEKLIEAWPWLAKLVDENRDSMILLNKISEDAFAWNKDKRDIGYLYSSGRLETIRDQILAKGLKLNALAQEFIDASLVEQTKREQAKAQQRRRERRLLVASMFVSIILVGLMIFG